MGELFDVFIGFLQSFLTIFYQFSTAIGMPNYGVAIILMTIVIKVLLYPLTVKQVKSMKAMQDLQPKVKKIQEKYGKKDPQRMQQEMAALYKEAGVNPVAGCLPLIAQMPLLIGIFYAIRDYTYLNTPSFFWIQNLSEADPTYFLPILSAVTIYIQQKQTMSTGSDANQQAKIMMYMMPLFIGYISLTFPAGLVLYWAMSNIMQIIQQWWMYRSDEGQKKGVA